ncbi:reverse transcriptase domain-containing protein [Tanacetum coccineum]
MTESEAKQMSVYFVSRALQGLEINYTSMEKLVLALVHASKHLKRYFQAHTIIVITDQPIKQILSRLEVVGRLQKWSIKLGEYDIQYIPSTSVKGQILADFIVERLEDDPLYTSMEAEEELPDPIHLSLYHEFTGELIIIPPRIVREHEDYINRMSLLYGNSSSQSPENSHTIIESLPTSTTLIEDNDSNREEIDIFSGPDNSIPSSIESDFDSEEDIIDNLLNDDLIPEYEHLTFDMEPDVHVINNGDELNEDECFDPEGGEINIEVDDSFTFEMRIFIPYLTYPEVSPLLSSTKNEDTIFDSDIFAFHFSSQEPVVVKCFMEFYSSTCFISKDE